jgi:SAM-dependent methyltransferase
MNAHTHDRHEHRHAHSHATGSVPGASSAMGHPERITPGDAYWDRHYSEHVQRYEFAAARMPAGARVLDAGCGVGYGTSLLGARGARIAVGVDLAPEALAVARSRFDGPNVRWIAEDCVRLEAAAEHAPFDLIVNFENLEHVGDPERFLDRVAALLADDGVFVVSTPNRIATNRMHGALPDGGTGNPFHEREYSAAELHAALSARFGQVTLHFQAFDPPERYLYEPILALLWSNPFVRLGRWMQRVLRRRSIVERIDDLLPERTHRIYATDPGPLLSLVLIAECRRPLRATE